MVRMRFEPRRLESDVNKEASNWAPRSVVMVEGTPKMEIHLETKARATVSAVISGSGMASGHRVKRSMHVSR